MDTLCKERYLLWQYTTQDNCCHDHDHKDNVVSAGQTQLLFLLTCLRLEAVCHILLVCIAINDKE